MVKGGDGAFDNGQSAAGYQSQRMNTEGDHPDWHSRMRSDRMVPMSREYPVTKEVTDPDYLTLAVLSSGTK